MPEYNDILRLPEVRKVDCKIDEDCNYAVFVSYVEIYNNYVFDLLDETPTDNKKWVLINVLCVCVCVCVRPRYVCTYVCLYLFTCTVHTYLFLAADSTYVGTYMYVRMYYPTLIPVLIHAY